MPMIEKIVQTAKHTVKATVLALRMRVDWGWASLFIARFPSVDGGSENGEPASGSRLR
jgi:hypothetical protein